jgi:hypothetical protein
MRHSTIKLTADLYTDLGMTDVAEDCWALEPLFDRLPTAGPVAFGTENGTAGPGSEKDLRRESA